ncbi:MAG: DUF2809 domain-containing protein [Candidatus Delongbacteria bacterium]|nr:DUF2809 domain-containing protein [Candidatus Delongbacteria bacterium]
MHKSRLINLTIIILTIITGLLSRKISFIPFFIGDLLWAFMMYYIIRLILVKSEIIRVFIISLIISFSVEFSQLYQADWINNIRHTLLGRLILGQGFLWSDLLAYTAGCILAMILHKYYILKLERQNNK